MKKTKQDGAKEPSHSIQRRLSIPGIAQRGMRWAEQTVLGV